MTTHSPRILTATETGSAYYNKIKPLIRLHGKWLTHAGIPVGSKVEVHLITDGVLEIRRLDPPKPIIPTEPRYTSRAKVAHANRLKKEIV